jgi:hypothetical protein
VKEFNPGTDLLLAADWPLIFDRLTAETALEAKAPALVSTTVAPTAVPAPDVPVIVPAPPEPTVAAPPAGVDCPMGAVGWWCIGLGGVGLGAIVLAMRRG